MTAYLLRRLLYAVPILIGVNLLTFVLFFVVNSPDDMARLHLGNKHVTADAIADLEARPRLRPAPAVRARGQRRCGASRDTLFFEKSARLLVLDFGHADDGRDIGRDIRQRMGPSLAIAVPGLILGLLTNITLALGVVFVRGSGLERAAVFLAVVGMSISTLFYIIGAQYLLAKLLNLAPVSGWQDGWAALKFLILPLLVGVVSGIGGGLRWYRLLFLEEAGKDYVRTARAKGLSEGARARPPRAAQCRHSDPDRRGGGDPAAVHGRPADRVVLRHPGPWQLHHRRHPEPGFLHRAGHGVPGRAAVPARPAADRHLLHAGRPAGAPAVTAWPVQPVRADHRPAAVADRGRGHRAAVAGARTRRACAAAFRQLARRPVAMASLVFLAPYVAVALLDSLHFRPPLADTPGAYSPVVESVLDRLLTPLRERTEKTYSAPLALYSYARETVTADDGSVQRVFPRLEHGGAHLADAGARARATSPGGCCRRWPRAWRSARC